MASSKVVYSPEFLAQDRSGRVIATGVVFFVLEVFFFGAYLTSRVRSKAVKHLETLLMVLAFIFCIALVIQLFLVVIYAGEGHHDAALPLYKSVTWLKIQLAYAFLYPPAVALPKLAVLCLYHRLFSIKAGHRLVVYIIAAVLILTWVASLIVSCLYCTPFSYFWTRVHKGTKGTCIDTHEVFIYITIPNLATDMVMLVLPQLIVWKLKMSRMQKIGLALTFLTGSIGIITAFYRLSIFIQPSTAADNPWLGIPTTILTTVEPGVYFIAATLPSLRNLFGKIFNSIWTSISSSIFTSHRTSTQASRSQPIVLSDGVLSGTNQTFRSPYTRFGNASDVVYPSSDKLSTSMDGSSRDGEIPAHASKLCNKIVIIKKQWGIAREDLEKGTRQ